MHAFSKRETCVITTIANECCHLGFAKAFNRVSLALFFYLVKVYGNFNSTPRSPCSFLSSETFEKKGGSELSDPRVNTTKVSDRSVLDLLPALVHISDLP